MSKAVRFGIIADCQYADIEPWLEADRHFRESLGKLRRAVEFFNTQDLDFVIHLGDLIDGGLANADAPLEILSNLKTKLYLALGNHDFNEPDKDQNSPKDVLAKMRMPAPYYGFDVEDWRFLVLDSNEIGVVEGPKDGQSWKAGEALLKELRQAGKRNANDWNGALSPEQDAWMCQQIREAEEQGRQVILFAHHPIYPEHHDNMLNDDKFVRELSAMPAVKAYISGHQHFGNYEKYGKLHCLTMKAIVQTPASNAYAIGELSNHGLAVTGYGREASRQLDF